MEKLIKRINELAKKSREEGLTDAEKAEQVNNMAAGEDCQEETKMDEEEEAAESENPEQEESKNGFRYRGFMYMKCPECGNKMREGFVEVKEAGSLTQRDTMVTWYPEEERGKMFKKDGVSLWLKADGYYCDQCMKVIAIFDERYR